MKRIDPETEVHKNMKIMAILLSFIFVLVTSSYALAAANPAACNYPFYNKGVYQGISYLNGGVGKEERLCLAPLEKEYNLKMVFALNSKPYLANEAVKIQDQNGREVFQSKADGPWLLVNLPAGEYKVTVSREGHESEVRNVQIGNETHVEYFVWKS